jgi:hypothetical protein
MLLICENADVLEEREQGGSNTTGFRRIEFSLEHRIKREGIDNLSRTLAKDDSNPSYDRQQMHWHGIVGAYLGKRSR